MMNPKHKRLLNRNSSSLSHQSCLCKKAVRKAAIAIKIDKHVTPHAFLYSFVTHLLEARYDILTVQELLGQKTSKLQ
jgi:site-specific recombinase XerC